MVAFRASAVGLLPLIGDAACLASRPCRRASSASDFAFQHARFGQRAREARPISLIPARSHDLRRIPACCRTEAESAGSKSASEVQAGTVPSCEGHAGPPRHESSLEKHARRGRRGQSELTGPLRGNITHAIRRVDYSHFYGAPLRIGAGSGNRWRKSANRADTVARRRPCGPPSACPRATGSALPLGGGFRRAQSWAANTPCHRSTASLPSVKPNRESAYSEIISHINIQRQICLV